MKCYICDATISQLNDLEMIKTRPIKSEMFRFGLSILHAHIRFFECILHISYRLDFKQWKATKKNGSKQLMKNRKKIVQHMCRSELGLIVDVPKPGYGTSNDGNTARRFFLKSTKSCIRHWSRQRTDYSIRVYFNSLIHWPRTKHRSVSPVLLGNSRALRTFVSVALHATFSAQNIDTWSICYSRTHCPNR